MALSITVIRMIQEIGFQTKICIHYDLFVFDVYLSQYLMMIQHVPGQVLFAINLSNTFYTKCNTNMILGSNSLQYQHLWLQIAVEIKLGLIAYDMLDQPITFLHQYSMLLMPFCRTGLYLLLVQRTSLSQQPIQALPEATGQSFRLFTLLKKHFGPNKVVFPFSFWDKSENTQSALNCCKKITKNLAFLVQRNPVREQFEKNIIMRTSRNL